MTRSTDPSPQSAHRKQDGGKAKPIERPAGPRVDPVDPVEEASYESFPASDPPAFMSPSRTGQPKHKRK